MAHKVLVGGFASGARQMEKVARSLALHYDEDVDAISFREAMEDPIRLEHMIRRADVITHSAGMLAVRGTSPETLLSVAPPVPVWAPLLAARAIASTTELALHSVPLVCEADEVDGCIRDATAELLLHLEGNLRWMGQIALFDALQAARAAQEAGIATGLALMSHDKLFQSRPHNIEVARQVGVNVVIIPGTHEDFIKHPRQVLHAYEQGQTVGATAETELTTMVNLPSLLSQPREAT